MAASNTWLSGAPGGASALPQDTHEVLRLAARSMFDQLAQAAQGMMVVDRQHRIVWISDGYKTFLPALGFDSEADFVGKRVEEVVPNTLMAQVIETGQAMLVDLLSNHAGTFLVSRLPLRDDAGEVIGALGLVLMDHPETTMQPLMTKFGRLQKALEDAQRQLAEQRRPKYTIASFIGSCPGVMEVKRLARRVAGTDSTVLLLGETGTGKELLAQAIHAGSHRAARAFVGVNIAAVPDSLMEAEFFGVAPGAYTGADRKARPGKFKLAHGGTLFLDEIGDMPLALQAKLLRVLQEREVEPLGSNKVEPLDVRVIAATSRDLAAMVEDGSFRADLYYRLKVLPIRLPPLRERLADLDALTDSLLEDIGRSTGLSHRSLAADALDLLARHRWPGNIRELRNVLEQVCLMSDELHLGARQFDGVLEPVSGPPAGAGEPDSVAVPPQPVPLPVGWPGAAPAAPPAPPAPPAPGSAPGGQSLPEAIAALESQAIQAALQATGGNKLAAAKLLGIARATLYDKLAGMHPADTLA
jgi:transcriptional regulator with PAS, ATPase and Fis domain